MQRDAVAPAMSRRQLLRLIGVAGGSAAMYQAMSVLGFARASTFSGFPELGAAPAGASVLVLGAGIAGMVAAYELSMAGYRVLVLEYGARAGGRVMTLRGGDRYTELGGATQECRFDPGLYINPGPWRLPHHHHGILGYCRLFGVPLELFEQLLRLPEVGDRVFGDILPLAQGGVFQPVADHHVRLVPGAQPRDDVRPDEAGPAGDHDHPPTHLSSFIFSIVFVVE